MKHKQKVKLARRLRTKEEKAKGVALFQTKGWLDRKDAIAKGVKTRQTKTHLRAVERKAILKQQKNES